MITSIDDRIRYKRGGYYGGVGGNNYYYGGATGYQHQEDFGGSFRENNLLVGYHKH
jgi:hypothetical protein